MRLRWQHSQWAREIAALNRWAIWCVHGNTGEIMRACGLTWAGSPKTIMSGLWEKGAAELVDAYERPDYEAHTPDYLSMDVDEFMIGLKCADGAAYQAVLARHARVVHGEPDLLHSDTWLARSLYCRSERHSRRMMNTDCERAYSLLRKELTEFSAA